MTAEPMRDWFDRAGVRVDPRRVLTDELDGGKVLFPARLIPYLGHRLVDRLDDEARAALVARHTYHYFAFTAHFETRVVNRATEMLANGRADVPLRRDVRFDAYKIYCDEAYHALYSFDVVRQLESASRVAALPYDFTPFLNRLDGISSDVMPRRGTLPQLLQVVVFETLVTTLLAELPNDPDLVGLVRETVRDHARDEGRHHAFFAHLFRELWAGLDPAARRETARCLPRLIGHSLRPDLRPARANLAAAGLTPAQVEEVVRDVYHPDSVRRGAHEQAVQSVKLFRSCGVLDLPEGLDAFHEEGLL
ncbi:diiron oxygenase [Micromonospora sp. WMMD975]|uniref:diiron oxygenase n=1 Tax=Micromonospora sp. WMMD975 TaxID=3016087 RepID=UPI00249BF491|nr:diiron oxygenase [Micromonospora sp. WMMD975]WFE36549.1 diiron oxygenase [Micromonospora sp. WMMD975]